jgi:hypothetical protein
MKQANQIIKKKYFYSKLMNIRTAQSMNYTKLVQLVIILLLASCGNKNIDLQGFDIATWKNDKKGCQNKRIALLADFEQKVKPQLEGLTEMQVSQLLGKADFSLLAERNQKFYRYYLEEGEQCAKNKKGRYINIRFDATNMVNEVSMVHY